MPRVAGKKPVATINMPPFHRLDEQRSRPLRCRDGAGTASLRGTIAWNKILAECVTLEPTINRADAAAAQRDDTPAVSTA
jgi:hypothetical protein